MSEAPCIPEPQKKFGTFVGVFTPSILTILGVIMYLRFGWVLAHAGLTGTIAIVLMCGVIALMTALSASAVATNMPLGAGGEYYLISRSVGLTIGGAIGIPLYLCRTLSITLYCFGLTEVVAMVWPVEAWGAMPVQWTAAGLIVLVAAVSGRSAALALKAQLPLMVLVGLSLLALGVGVFLGPLKQPVWRVPAERMAEAGGFWTIFAVFFPAVTGFAAGIGMSGDLKNPQRSIPRGSLGSVIVGTVVYLIVPVVLASSAKVGVEQLGDIRPTAPPVWTLIAVAGPWLVFPGMLAAILSSAFGSALAGPRVLQALASDGLAPRFLARASKRGQPVVASAVTGGLALVTVLLGDLNAVAELVTIFFLTLYLSINLVAAIEQMVADPSYRPTIRVPAVVSLLGAMAVFCVMFLINHAVAFAAIGLEVLLWLYLRRRVLDSSWGDVWSGVWDTLARISLRKLHEKKGDPRSWRPNILLFADEIEQRAEEARLAGQFNASTGVLTICDCVVGRARTDMPEADHRRNELNAFIEREGLHAFGEVDVVNDFDSGVMDIIQAHGLGALRANTITFGWPSDTERLAELLRLTRNIGEIGRASMFLRPHPHPRANRREAIDVWWRGKQKNGDLMLLLAYLLQQHAAWRRAKIRVRTIISNPTLETDMRASLDRLLQSVRIDAEREIIALEEDQSVMDVMHESSRETDLAFVGLMTPEPGDESEYAERLKEIVAGLPMTVLVRNTGPFAGELL
ncbi:MAG: amino acid permease [Bacteroidetes bacterium]|jgi:amino acid transporter|nr:amino acid permease [Bacteroidota bacterium]